MDSLLLHGFVEEGCFLWSPPALRGVSPGPGLSNAHGKEKNTKENAGDR